MKKILGVTLGLLFILFTGGWAWALNISPTEVPGKPGNVITVPINISDVGSGLDVDAFDFAIQFDKDVLTFDEADGIDKTDILIENFTIVSGKIAEPGKVKIGGILFGTPVHIGSKGLFLKIKFTVNATADKDSYLKLSDFKSDIANAITTDAKVTVDDGSCYGTLKVTISPQEAADAHAAFLVNGHSYNSGAIVDLLCGDHTVEFRDISGWCEPDSIIVTIENGQQNTIDDVTYQSGDCDDCTEWQSVIHAEGENLGGYYKNDVTIGIGSQASTSSAPPEPPNFTCFMNLLPDYAKDIRQCGEDTYTWEISINPHGNMSAPTDMTSKITWDFSTVPEPGYFQLRKGTDGTGETVVSDMVATKEYTVTGGNAYQNFTIVYSQQQITVCTDLELDKGWNLICLPVTPDDSALKILFPDAEVAYEYKDGGYAPAISLIPGKGYWVKLLTGGLYEICGQDFSGYTATLSPAWHLMGAINASVIPETNPIGSIEVMYKYAEGGYIPVTEFEPGYGYWVKTTESCEFAVDSEN